LASGPTPAGPSDVKAASDSHSAHKERQRFCSSAYAFTHLVCDDLDVDNNATTTTTVLRRADLAPAETGGSALADQWNPRGRVMVCRASLSTSS
jgi:hypothetical protein